jgi:hypothetical protein
MVAAIEPLELGSVTHQRGTVTTLNAIAASSPWNVEEMLGYQRGRLSDGYAILLLKQTLTTGDFTFAGNTLRSGGKIGLPASDPSADRERVTIHDIVMNREGAERYRKLQLYALSQINLTGDRRIIRVYPFRRHDPDLAPNRQYPMGGGALQWELKIPKTFLVGMVVGKDKIARTAEPFEASFGEKVKYDDRARIYRYLESA